VEDTDTPKPSDNVPSDLSTRLVGATTSFDCRCERRQSDSELQSDESELKSDESELKSDSELESDSDLDSPP
jgi:hypothetical protein